LIKLFSKAKKIGLILVRSHVKSKNIKMRPETKKIKRHCDHEINILTPAKKKAISQTKTLVHNKILKKRRGNVIR